ncbi:MAG: PD40 domain-containing protein [Planctomycetes bacterium]|nr:PD40 domain-containing protein [Planctomycetota bacterium]
MIQKFAFLTLGPFLFLASFCNGQTTTRVSVDSQGTQGTLWSEAPSISANGRYVAFYSFAGNLVPGDTNTSSDIFVHDRHTGVTERVSVTSQGVEANNNCNAPAISADGRFVAFDSIATNLVPGDSNGLNDVFIHDRQTGITERVNVSSLGVEANYSSGGPSISGDGNLVAFESYANNLVPGDTNSYDIFVRDRQAGTTQRVSVDSQGTEANGYSHHASISTNGRFVAFHSTARNLVPNDTNSIWDVFVHDRQTGSMERVSVDSQGVEGNYINTHASISGDGRYVAFYSASTNLIANDFNAAGDIFVHDRQTHLTNRVSVGQLGVEANSISQYASISEDGQYVAFHSYASNLVPGDTNAAEDIFVHDRASGLTERLSVSSSGQEGEYKSTYPSISADGRYVAFRSDATELVPADTNWYGDIFAHDRWDGLGSNSIHLTGPATAPVGFPLALSWNTARPNSQYWLAYSMTLNGSVVGGHSIDLGAPQTILASGVNPANGAGSYSSAPVPAGAAGLTVYFEMVARDAAAVLYDSNALAVVFY